MNYWELEEVDISILNGETIVSIVGLEKASEEVRFHLESGKTILFYHEQDCCEVVSLEDFEADSDDYAGALIISAETVSAPEGFVDPWADSPYCESSTWTFYKIETSLGGIWMRWLGESNGYYSEYVSIAWENKPKEEGK